MKFVKTSALFYIVKLLILMIHSQIAEEKMFYVLITIFYLKFKKI